MPLTHFGVSMPLFEEKRESVKSQLIDVPPQSVQRLSDATIFYYGAEHGRLQLLPANAQFIMVYSPNTHDGWQVVRYNVIEGHKGYSVLERRALEADEIHYFERLLRVM